MEYVPLNKIKEIISRFPRPQHDLEASGIERGLNILIEDWDNRFLRLFKEELLKQISLEALELSSFERIEGEKLGDFGFGEIMCVPCSQEVK